MKRIIAMFLSALTMFSLCAFPAYAIGQDAEQNAYETVVTISGEENIRRYLASVGEEYDPTLLCIQRRVRNTPISPDSPNNRNLSPNTFIREYVIRTDKTSVRQVEKPQGGYRNSFERVSQTCRPRSN